MNNKLKIGILTITPNIGYGGILQAYALKCLLEQLFNAEVAIIRKEHTLSLKQKVTFFLKKAFRWLVRREYVKLTYSGDYNYRKRNVESFHKKYLNFTQSVKSSKELHKLINNSFDVVIVGSDQVWRPRYVDDIQDYYFYSINDNIIKVAYAVSLGVNVWEYTKEQTIVCEKLAKKFTYISVREKDAIELLKQNLHVGKEIYWDLDPTMMADLKIYDSLISANHLKEPYVFAYILDPTDDKERLVHLIETSILKKILFFNTNAENIKKPLKERIAPKVEDWLTSIYYSDFVVTDSFHGCVFAILFNKPFIVYGNTRRGISRFLTLLSVFNLNNRLVLDSKSFDKKLMQDHIDWENINNIIAERKMQTIVRLNSIL